MKARRCRKLGSEPSFFDCVVVARTAVSNEQEAARRKEREDNEKAAREKIDSINPKEGIGWAGPSTFELPKGRGMLACEIDGDDRPSGTAGTGAGPINPLPLIRAFNKGAEWILGRSNLTMSATGTLENESQAVIFSDLELVHRNHNTGTSPVRFDPDMLRDIELPINFFDRTGIADLSIPPSGDFGPGLSDESNVRILIEQLRVKDSQIDELNSRQRELTQMLRDLQRRFA